MKRLSLAIGILLLAWGAQAAPQTETDQHGIVKSFSDAKGYGFITPDDKSADVFVYFTAIQASGFQTLKPGQRVTYDLQSGPKGSQAINVRLGNGKDHRPDSH